MGRDRERKREILFRYKEYIDEEKRIE